MNNKIFLFLLSISFFVSSQSIDENFLESLPVNIQQDVLNEASKSQSQDQNIYRSPNTKQELPGEIVERLIREIDEVKKRYAANDGQEKNLKRFGDGFFSSIQSSFMPINDPSFSNGYIINPSDKLKLQLIGPKSGIYDLEVERDGSVSIPNIGKFFIAGMQLENVDIMLREAINLKLTGSSTFLTLTGIGDIQILMVGNVKNPGIYTISGNTNILHALDVAGGIAENGSYRNISIKRNNNLIADVDLYEMFIYGNTAQDYNLKSGDTILVGPTGSQVTISGAVSNPAIYEIKKKDLASLIMLANGLTQDLDSERTINVNRKNKNINISINSELEALSKFQLQAGDNVYVPKYIPKAKGARTISIEGQVYQPGIYTINDDETLSSVIKRAGGYKSNAYTIGSVLRRESLKKLEEDINERIYMDLIKYIINTSSQTASGGGESGLPLLLSEFKDTKPVGRMPAEFDIDILENDINKDIAMRNGDEIYIPPMPSEIYVFGEVMNPGSRIYNSASGYQEYIKESGGLTNFALDSHIVIVSPDGIARKGKQSLFLNSSSLLPGTLIYVPREVGKRDSLQVTALLTNVFSSLAISLASLNSISD